MSELPPRVWITEQSPRDGLQDVKEFIATEKKAQLVRLLAATGVEAMSVASFVSPRWVPQMQDAEALLETLGPAPRGVRYTAVAPNRRALERVLALPENIRPAKLGVPASASETFQKKNVNKTIGETLAEIAELLRLARAEQMTLGSSVSMAFGCPYEGDIPIARVVEVATGLYELGINEITLADTTGTSNPALVQAVCAAVLDACPDARINLHIHDSRGMGLACVLAALEVGVTRFDGSAAGLGGCPYAKGARGNIATEDLVHMLGEMGIETGVDLEKLLEAARYIENELGLPATSQVLRAGVVEH